MSYQMQVTIACLVPVAVLGLGTLLTMVIVVVKILREEF